MEAGAVSDGRLDTRLPGAAQGSAELRQGESPRGDKGVQSFGKVSRLRVIRECRASAR